MKKEISFKLNFYAFIWHATFLALAVNFMNIDTIIPAVLLKAGGTSFELGILTAITIGVANLFQLFFAGFLSHQQLKKKYLLIGIHLRVISLFFLGLIFLYVTKISNKFLIFNILLIITIFSISGAFANISYTDILGKAIRPEDRKKFFTLRQSISSIGILLSSFIIKLILEYYHYPINYSILFFTASLLLGIATIGFWLIDEPLTKLKNTSFNLIKYLKDIPYYIKNDKNLLYYLIVVNILSFSLTIIPFLIDFAKKNFKLTGSVIGNFLILRTLGMLIASMLLLKTSKHKGYKGILKITVIIGAMIPILALILIKNYILYISLFFLIGVFFALYQITISGILLEISNEENRAIYTGISGVGSIGGIIFPSISGFLIGKFGHSFIFITGSLFILTSLIFIPKFNCAHLKK